MKAQGNRLRSAKRNRLKGYLTGANIILTRHHYQSYLYPDEQAAVARITVEVRKLLTDWIPELPGKGESQ